MQSLKQLLRKDLELTRSRWSKALGALRGRPNIDEATFKQQAEGAKKGCPVSQALAGTQIELDARLVNA